MVPRAPWNLRSLFVWPDRDSLAKRLCRRGSLAGSLAKLKLVLIELYNCMLLKLKNFLCWSTSDLQEDLTGKLCRSNVFNELCMRTRMMLESAQLFLAILRLSVTFRPKKVFKLLRSLVKRLQLFHWTTVTVATESLTVTYYAVDLLN